MFTLLNGLHGQDVPFHYLLEGASVAGLLLFDRALVEDIRHLLRLGVLAQATTLGMLA